MIGKGNIRITKNLPASGRLRAIFAKRWAQYREQNQETIQNLYLYELINTGN